MDACNHPAARRIRRGSRGYSCMRRREEELKWRRIFRMDNNNNEIGDGIAATRHNRMREAIANKILNSEKVERLHRMAKEKVEKMKKGYCDVIKTTPEDEKIAGCEPEPLPSSSSSGYKVDEEVAHKIAGGLTLDV